MFRTACIFVALALCAAVAPPKISLDLTQQPRLDVGKHATLHGKAAALSLDYDETCNLGSTVTDCKFPVAKAFDHVGGQTDVTTTIKLVNREGVDSTPPAAYTCNNDCTSVDDLASHTITKNAMNLDGTSSTSSVTLPAADFRSQFIFQYNAQDDNNNDAETVTYILTITDAVAPEFTTDSNAPAECSDRKYVVEFGNQVDNASGTKLRKCIDYCRKPKSAVFVNRAADITNVQKVGATGVFSGTIVDSSTAWDAGSGLVDADWTQEWDKQFYLDGTAATTNMQTWDGAKFTFDSVCDDSDAAGIYLEANQELKATRQHEVTLRDTSPPVVTRTPITAPMKTYECDRVDPLTINPTYKGDSPAFEDALSTGFPVTVADQNGNEPLLSNKVTSLSTFETNALACSGGGVGNCVQSSTHEYEVTYDARDDTQNTKQIKRSFKIQDTTPPTIHYHNNNLNAIDNIQVGIRSDTNLNVNSDQILKGKTSTTTTTKAAVGEDFPDTHVNGGALDVNWVGASATWADITGMADKLMGTFKNDTCASGEMAQAVGTWYKCDTNVVTCLALATQANVQECTDLTTQANQVNCRIGSTVPMNEAHFSHNDKYLRVHVINDGNGNSALEKEIVTLVDEESPIISVKGCDTADEANGPEYGHVCKDTVDASDGSADSWYTSSWPRHGHAEADKDSSGNYPYATVYKDQGASCSDFVDGPLSHAVEVSGAIVSLVHPEAGGKLYQINYNCQDLSGTSAPQASRLVTVLDRTPPKVTLNNAQEFDIEAGYTFVDPGATAIDDMASSGQLKWDVKYEEVTNDALTTPLSNPTHPACTVSAAYASGTSGSWSAPQETSTCTVNTTKCGVNGQGLQQQNGVADEGCKYTITYTATDLNGNSNSQTRTVKVQDTLAPIIVLTGPTEKQFQASSTLSHSGSTNGHNRDRVNPHNNLGNKMQSNNIRHAHGLNAVELAKAGIAENDYKGDSTNLWPSLMAETTSVNGWFVGAIACAVTGVALLSLATRKTSVTEVPV